jgi:hypothetical protein
MNLTSNTPENLFYNEYNEKPLKYRITYKRINEYSDGNEIYNDVQSNIIC